MSYSHKEAMKAMMDVTSSSMTTPIVCNLEFALVPCQIAEESTFGAQKNTNRSAQ